MTSPPASSERVRKVMQANRSTDTGPEVALRNALQGMHFTVNQTLTFGQSKVTPDIVFGLVSRVAVFVDGCFWHGCPAHYRPARVNHAYWADKVAGNMRRDRAQTRLLRRHGWSVVRVWEHTRPCDGARVVRSVVTRRLRALEVV